MYKQRDIILIPMPYTDLSAEKKRPALVLSGDAYNESCSDILAVMVTSTRHRMPYDIAIAEDDMASGELPKQSYVRSDRIFSIAQKLIVKTYGSVTDTFYQTVHDSVDKLISSPERT
ncbi:MAG: type II toxin-antitoxin system PemK/MazF family toxin [Oscillospiraceae bacterium]|nr:type II toxin-antitoxin system PemK/MazF family toxin [Oscillospiraceae bacterium]